MRLQDILDSIAKAERYTRDMDFGTFSADEKTVDAVARNIEIIGEAVRHVPPEIQKRSPQVPWAEMRGMRNVVAHEYFELSLRILWETVRQDLQRVPPLLEEILAREG